MNKTTTKTIIQPAHDYVLISRKAEEETTPGGLVLPDQAREKENQGMVVNVGPGRKDDNGHHIPVDFDIGDQVIFGGYAGNEVEANGEQYLLIREGDILAILR